MTANFPLFSELKIETADLHRRIETFMPVTRTDFTVEKYPAHLERMLGFYLSLDSELARVADDLDQGLGIAKRYKSGWLVSDLVALGETPSALAKLPKATDISPIQSLPELVGTLYVTEGATLGGRVVREILVQRLGLTDSVLHFYTGYGCNTDKMWASFKERAAGLVTDSKISVAVAAARTRFQELTNWLKGS